MRYLLFGKDEFYYAAGGAHDYLGSGDSVDALVNSKVLEDEDGERICWWHVFDTETREIVAGTRYQAHSAPDIKNGVDS